MALQNQRTLVESWCAAHLLAASAGFPYGITRMVPRVLPRAEVCFARFALAGFLLAVNPAPLALAAETGRPQHQLIELQGQVEVLRKGATAWVRASTNMFVITGDSIRTGKDSRAA